jgi:hypothetical protein
MTEIQDSREQRRQERQKRREERRQRWAKGAQGQFGIITAGQQCIDRSLYTPYWHCCFNESNDPRFS